MEISIIIVSHNSYELILELIESLSEYVHDWKSFIKVYVVENGLNHRVWDNDTFIQNENQIQTVFPPRNLGYGGAVNYILPKIETDLIIVANADLIFNSNPFIKITEYFKTNNNIGVVGLQQYFPNGTTQTSIGHSITPINILKELFFLTIIESKLQKKQSEKLNESFYIDGAFMIFDTNTLKQVGGFDESFFFYFEDMDISNRLNVTGLNNIILRDSSIIHIRSANSKNSYDDYSDFALKQYFHSLQVYIKKNYTGFRYGIVVLFLSILSFQKLIIGSFLFYVLGISKYKRLLSRHRYILTHWYDFIL